MLLNDGRVVSNFIAQTLEGKPLKVFGDGAQTRSFCYVDELIDGRIRLMKSLDEVIGPPSLPLNPGNPVEFTILELAEKVIELTKARTQKHFHGNAIAH